MKAGSVKVGIKGHAVKVPCDIPENITDLETLAKGSEGVLVRWAKRGLQIERQENSGARDHVRANEDMDDDTLAAEVAKIVADYDPTITKVRAPRTAKATEVALPANVEAMSREELTALLASAGVKVVDAAA